MGGAGGPRNKDCSVAAQLQRAWLLLALGTSLPSHYAFRSATTVCGSIRPAELAGVLNNKPSSGRLAAGCRHIGNDWICGRFLKALQMKEVGA